MKYREVIIEQLKNQPYFTKQAVFQLAEGYSIKKSTINSYIVRSLACKDIIQLKRGVYVTTDFYTKNKINNSYIFYLANILRSPSYVSSWAALQYYDLVTEAIYGVTSITQKVTRKYETKIGSFSYQSIQKELFSDFSLVKGKFDFFIATPSKALFDLLYFRTKQFRGITFDMIGPMVEDLRIDIDEMDKKEQENFYSLVKKYLKHE